MAALSASFLATEQVDVDSLERRFNLTPYESTTWGLVNDVVLERAETAPGYLDVLPQNLAQDLVNYLSNNSYPQNDLASLIVAMEGESGLMSLGKSETQDRSASVIYLDQRTLKGNMGNVPLARIRGLR